uniref:Uncharacterized protein n=1 Tax=Mycena chlorophos TaxID=658473 RepID=A0ABQ0L599_MYCCL|nr:predicted protein [Mycena chlorophos]
MTDLTFCCLHMSNQELAVLDALETPEFLSDDPIPNEMNIPPHMIPPNPELESHILPSQTHPSYPYGDPTSKSHPTAKPRPLYDPSSRALFEDLGFGGLNINGAHRWRDLALDTLLQLDPVKEEAIRAADARKMTNGAANAPQVTAEEEEASEDALSGEEESDEEEDSEADSWSNEY